MPPSGVAPVSCTAGTGPQQRHNGTDLSKRRRSNPAVPAQVHVELRRCTSAPSARLSSSSNNRSRRSGAEIFPGLPRRKGTMVNLFLDKHLKAQDGDPYRMHLEAVLQIIERHDALPKNVLPTSSSIENEYDELVKTARKLAAECVQSAWRLRQSIFRVFGNHLFARGQVAHAWQSFLSGYPANSCALTPAEQSRKLREAAVPRRQQLVAIPRLLRSSPCHFPHHTTWRPPSDCRPVP